MAALPVSHPGVARTLGEDPGTGTGLLLDLVKDPAVREAVEVSSASLADTLAKAERGTPLDEAKVRRATLAVTRYVLRMTGRPTPFGLLAGVRTARLDAGPGEAYVRTGSAHRKHARADAAWLDGIAARLHHDPGARDALRVVANNLRSVRGDRLVLPYVRAPRGAVAPESAAGQEPVPYELTVGYGPVVRAALEEARRPRAYGELRDAVLGRFPEARPEDVDRLLTGLLDREVLLSDVAARQDRTDQLAHVNARLTGTTSPTAAGLREIARLLDDYSAAAPGAGREAWHAATAAMREVRAQVLGTGAAGAGGRPPVHVDLRVDCDVRLPGEVAREAADAAEALWRLAPAEGVPHLAAYHRAFLDRYGTDRPVPVRELLDPHRGLGVPAGYRVPAGERGEGSAPDVAYPAWRDEALGDALHDVLASASRGRGAGAELVLDRGLLDRLASPEPEDAAPRPPGSLDLCVMPLARSVEALASGDFRLLVSNGSYGAGAMTGRFAHVLDAEDELARVLGDGTEEDDGAPLPVQLFFQPRHARSNNVARVPRLLRHTVAVGCFPPEGGREDGAPHLDVPLDDLAVGADGDRLVLVQGSTGREVAVQRPSMLNLMTEAPNAARFLAGIGMSGRRPWVPWQWGGFAALPFLPRVRYGRTVLSPARWRPPAELRDPKAGEREWLRALEGWRERHAVPDLLRVSVLDHHLDLDLTAPVHRQVLRGQLTGRAAPLVQESPLAEPDGLGWSDGQVTEVVVPLAPTRPRPAAPAAPPPATARTRHAPGGEWLYAKVYAAGERLDGLLVRDLPRLLEAAGTDVDRWFFLRYRDPGAHLRLRLHGEPEAVREKVLLALHAWAGAAMEAGTLRKVVLDTYEPETDRYGGPAALVPAERLFHADSALVAGQLTARAQGRLTAPPETVAALNHAALLAALGDWDWWRWVLDTFPIGLTNALPAADRRAALALADAGARVPDGGEPRDAAARPGPTAATGEPAACRAALTSAARAYGQALGLGTDAAPSPARGAAVASLLHMHANRLLGTDPGAERRSYGLLRGIVRAHLGRAEHK